MNETYLWEEQKLIAWEFLNLYTQHFLQRSYIGVDYGQVCDIVACVVQKPQQLLPWHFLRFLTRRHLQLQVLTVGPNSMYLPFSAIGFLWYICTSDIHPVFSDHLWVLFPDVCMVIASEIAVDIVKHAFITKFNDITADVSILLNHCTFQFEIGYDAVLAWMQCLYEEGLCRAH